MKKQKHMLRTCLFLVILFLLIFLPGLVLTPKVVMKYHLGAGRNAVYSRIANEPKNTIDVLVMGDSESYTSISPMKIWNETGYTVYAAGQPGANLADTRNVLKTALESQKPKVILLETHSLFRNRKSQAFRKQSALAEKLYNAFPVLRYHNSWKQVFPQKMHATYKGFGVSSKVRPYTGPADYMNPPEGAPTVNPKDKDKVQNTISRANRRDFDAIRKTCEKHGIQLILYSAPSPKNYNIQRCDALAKLAKKTNVPYVDLNRRVEELQIDWATDTRDRGDHLNISGAIKTTGYLRDYLVQNCNLEDRRNDPLISAKWNRVYGNYEIAEKKKMKKINGDDTMNSLENLLAEGGTKKEVQD